MANTEEQLLWLRYRILIDARVHDLQTLRPHTNRPLCERNPLGLS